MTSSFLRFLGHKQRRITFGRTYLEEWSARRRDLYLTTHNTHNRQTSMPPAGFEPTIPASERPQTHTLDRAATGTGYIEISKNKCSNNNSIDSIFLKEAKTFPWSNLLYFVVPIRSLPHPAEPTVALVYVINRILTYLYLFLYNQF